MNQFIRDQWRQARQKSAMPYDEWCELEGFDNPDPMVTTRPDMNEVDVIGFAAGELGSGEMFFGSRKEAAYIWKATGEEVTYDEMVDITRDQGMITPEQAESYRASNDKYEKQKLREKAQKAMYQLSLGGPLTIKYIPFERKPKPEFDYEIAEMLTGRDLRNEPVMARKAKESDR